MSRRSIEANATVWLRTSTHRMCLWSARAGAIPSVSPSVEHAALAGEVEVELAGAARMRAPLRRWRGGHQVLLPGADASAWIESFPEPIG